ncbi:BRCA1-A complex subunit, partial [Takifugu flavidus]
YLQDLDKNLDVDPSDPQREAEHGWEHDEKQDHEHPRMEDPDSHTPHVLHHHCQLRRPQRRSPHHLQAGKHHHSSLFGLRNSTIPPRLRIQCAVVALLRRAENSMAAEPTVRVPGIVLASLMFHHLNSDSDVEGFILGESKIEEQVTINDSQADHIHIEEIYNVQKHLPCHELNNFYNAVSDVNMDVITKLLADNKQESIIGWYRQRRNTEQQMTFREKLVHEKLKSALSNPHLIFLLLTPSSVSPTGSTHRMEYAAFISRSRRFTNVPVLVNNLGLLEQLSYWKVSAPCSAAGYNLTMKKHGPKFFCSNGLLKEVSEVNKMNDSLQSELQVGLGVGVGGALRLCLKVPFYTFVSCLLESMQRGGRERAACGGTAGGPFSSQENAGEKKQDAVAKAAADRPPEQRNNLLLHEAIRSLFACSPLFHTQTLTLEGFPVPSACCSTAHDASTAAGAAEHHGLCSLVPPSGLTPWKRLKQMQPVRESKRRKSSS